MAHILLSDGEWKLMNRLWEDSPATITPLRQLDYGETGRMEVEHKDIAWAEAHPGSAQRQRRGVLFSPVSPGVCGKLPAGCPGFAAGIAGGFPPFSPPVVENPAAWWYTYYKELRIREEAER